MPIGIGFPSPQFVECPGLVGCPFDAGDREGEGGFGEEGPYSGAEAASEAVSLVNCPDGDWLWFGEVGAPGLVDAGVVLEHDCFSVLDVLFGEAEFFCWPVEGLGVEGWYWDVDVAGHPDAAGAGVAASEEVSAGVVGGIAVDADGFPDGVAAVGLPGGSLKVFRAVPGEVPDGGQVELFSCLHWASRW